MQEKTYGFADPANPADTGFTLFGGLWQLSLDLDLNPQFYYYYYYYYYHYYYYFRHEQKGGHLSVT